MFEDKTDRGQVGIGTLIVFIAMVLVAAIAAGVLVNTAGFLQENAEQTGQEAQSQVSDRLQVVSAYAEDTNKADTNVRFNQLNITVARASGSDDIDLTKVTVSYLNEDTQDSYQVQSGDVNNIVGSGDVLQNQDERASILLDVDQTDLDSGNGGNGLEPGDEFSLELTTASGATVIIEGRIPSTASDGEVILL
jgi:flagellin FlaB